MKKFMLCCLLACACCFLRGGPAEALIALEGEQNGASGIEVVSSQVDDPGDNDQAYPVQGNLLVEIRNHTRRYVGVYIDRITTPPGDTMRVVNGPNDDIIGPQAAVVSMEALDQLWQCAVYRDPSCAPPPSSRNYILPVPETLAPGTEVRYRIKVMGPALGGQLPFAVSGPDAPPEALLLAEATARTTFEMMVVPLIGTLTGGLAGDLFDAEKLAKEFSNFVSKMPDFWNAWQEGDGSKILRVVMDFLESSVSVKDFLARAGCEPLAQLLDTLQDWVFNFVQLLESSNVLFQLGFCHWLDEYDVWLIVPRVDAVDPADGQAGDHVTISGRGFDPYTTENNEVFFTWLDITPQTVLPALVLTVPDENTIQAEVPVGFCPGPLKVCVNGYCSNMDVLFGQALAATLAIVTPAEGAVLTGPTDINCEVHDAPSPFPGGTATLSVDGNPALEKTIDSPSFSLLLDTTYLALTDGPHLLEVALDIGGSVIGAQVNIEFASGGAYEPELVISSPLEGQTFAKNEVLRVAAQLLNAGPNGSSDQSVRYELLVDGQPRGGAYYRVKNTYPDCYSAELACLDWELAPGSHTLTLNAVGKEGLDYTGGPIEYELSKEVHINLVPALPGEENIVNLGNACHLDFSIYLRHKDDSGALLPIDLTLRFGYCPWQHHWDDNVDYCAYPVEISLCEIQSSGSYLHLGTAGFGAIQGTQARIYASDTCKCGVRMNWQSYGAYCSLQTEDYCIVTDWYYDTYKVWRAKGIQIRFWDCGWAMTYRSCQPPGYPY